MPNPRFVDPEGDATPELLEKIRIAKTVYSNSLDAFCAEWFLEKEGWMNVQRFYLIGSHAEEIEWKNEESDIDFKLVIPEIDSEMLRRFMSEVLRPKLCSSPRKKDWIDLYIVRDDSCVTEPRFDFTNDWNRY